MTARLKRNNMHIRGKDSLTSGVFHFVTGHLTISGSKWPDPLIDEGALFPALPLGSGNVGRFSNQPRQDFPTEDDT